MADLRNAFRDLRRTPGFTLTVVVTIAIAIGANTAIFSAVHGILLAPFPIARTSELVVVWDSEPERSLPVIELSYRQFERWASATGVFSSAAAIGSSTWPVVLEGRGESTRLALAGVSHSFFDTLGARPAFGRALDARDDSPGAPRAVVLSHTAWTRFFGADPAVVGSTIRLNRPCVVVGVMPEGFDFPRGTDVWAPVVPILADSGTVWNANALETVGVLFVVGRLANGVSSGAATVELNRIASSAAASRFGTKVVVASFNEHFFGPVRQALFALFTAVVVLLLIACANVSGLMLARMSSRRLEDAVRVALGATRRTLARHWALETGLVFAMGGAIGWIAAYLLLAAVIVVAPPDVARLSQVSINAPVMGFTFASIVAAAMLCGLPVVIRASAAAGSDALNSARSTHSRRTLRARSLLVVLQIAFSLALVVAATLVARSFVRLRGLHLGFVPDRVLTLHIEPRGVGDRRVNDWMERLIERVKTLPRVEDAGAVFLRPLGLGPIGQETWSILEGQANDEDTRRRSVTLNYQVATPGYFSTMRIVLVRGRPFSPDDRVGNQRVALVSETAARRLWPGVDPIGRRLLLPTFLPGDTLPVWRTVVGVVSDVAYRGIADVRLDVYDAAAQAPLGATDLVVRASGDLTPLLGAIQTEARRLDGRVVIDRVSTMAGVVSRETAPWRFGAWVLGVLAVVAFLLAGLGLFGLLSLDLTARRRELAIRLALGAQRRDVLRSIVASAGRRVAAGALLGFGAAAIGARGLGALLFGVTAFDRVSYGIALATIFVVVALASVIPARRAASIEPATLLRE